MVEFIPDYVPLRVMLNQMAVVTQIKTKRELNLPSGILIDFWAVSLRNSFNWHKNHDCLPHRFGIRSMLICTRENYSNGPDQCGIKCDSSVIIKGESDLSVFTTPCVQAISRLLGYKQLLYISKHGFRIYVDVTFSSSFWKFLRRIETTSSSGTEFEIKRPALYYKDSPDSLFEVEMSYNTINGICEIQCESSNSVTVYFDISSNKFADEIQMENVLNKLRSDRGARAPRPVSLKKQVDTVAPIYGQTINRSPLATPDDSEEQLSMDQYSFYQPSYRPLQEQQVGCCSE